MFDSKHLADDLQEIESLGVTADLSTVQLKDMRQKAEGEYRLPNICNECRLVNSLDFHSGEDLGSNLALFPEAGKVAGIERRGNGRNGDALLA
jgi:hypothetical protein